MQLPKCALHEDTGERQPWRPPLPSSRPARAGPRACKGRWHVRGASEDGAWRLEESRKVQVQRKDPEWPPEGNGEPWESPEHSRGGGAHGAAAGRGEAPELGARA